MNLLIDAEKEVYCKLVVYREAKEKAAQSRGQTGGVVPSCAPFLRDMRGSLAWLGGLPAALVLPVVGPSHSNWQQAPEEKEEGCAAC